MFGLLAGAIVGIVTHQNIGLWAAVGLCVGVLMDPVWALRGDEK